MAIEKIFDWFFKKTLFFWLPAAVIVLLIKKWRADRAKKTEEKEEKEEGE